jgi:hypothetical protein
VSPIIFTPSYCLSFSNCLCMFLSQTQTRGLTLSLCFCHTVLAISVGLRLAEPTGTTILIFIMTYARLPLNSPLYFH